MEEPMKEPLYGVLECAVKNQNEGSTVLQEVVRMTGLPEEYLDSALTGLLGKPEGSVNEMTLNELRTLLLDCLESMNAEMESNPHPFGGAVES
jgi:hypothetical protein